MAKNRKNTLSFECKVELTQYILNLRGKHLTIEYKSELKHLLYLLNVHGKDPMTQIHKLRDGSSFLFEYFQRINSPCGDHPALSEVEIMDELYAYLIMDYFGHKLSYTVYDIAPFPENYSVDDVFEYIHPEDYCHFKKIGDFMYYSNIIKFLTLIHHYSFQYEIDSGLHSLEDLKELGVEHIYRALY